MSERLPRLISKLLPAAATLALLSVPAGAQPAKRHPRALPGEELELKTKDGWTLAARYSPAQPGRLTFILLHQAGGRKEDWLPLARAMILKGFGILGLDLRGHGGSQNPPAGEEGQWWKFKKEDNEWANMSQDVDAAVEALKAKGVPESAVALGGADIGSSVALRYAAVNKAVPQVFLLSPGLTYRDLTTVNAMRKYGRRPILIVVAQDDRHSLPETGILYQFAKISAGEENVSLIKADREHGTKMLSANAGLVDHIVDWMEFPVQAPAAPSVSTGASPAAAPVPGAAEMPADSQPRLP